MSATAIRLPISNVPADGDYSAQIAVGSQGTVVDVILDTGSSTLALNPGTYDPGSDTKLTTTTLAQDVLYGTGGWTGPVVKTALTMGAGAASVSVDTYLAIIDAHEAQQFGDAEGILGLAYNSLNNAYNVSSYLEDRGVKEGATYPWPFSVGDSTMAITRFGDFLSKMPQEDLTPYFTALATAGVAQDKFAFLTFRSWPTLRSQDPAGDPLNTGVFVLGGGEEQTDLYSGEFLVVDVVDDLYYNVDLLAVQVGENGTPIPAKALSPQSAKSMKSNAIVDSGTNALFLAPDVYEAVLNSLNKLDPNFGRTIAAANNGIAQSGLDLADWPDIVFVLRGPTGGSVQLACAPSTYWQTDVDSPGQAVFQVLNGGMPQSILGLPLLNNYYAVFDRSTDPYGVISFAKSTSPS